MSGAFHATRRWLSDDQLHADGSRVADLFEKNMSQASRKKPILDSSGRPISGSITILTTRREALHLYREILRYSNLFVWKDAQGRTWRDVLRQGARKEYEDARQERDPEILNKLIITGREAVQRTVEAFMKKRGSIIEDEANAQRTGLK